MNYCCLACGYRICQCGFGWQRVDEDQYAPVSPTITPRPPTLKAGDIVTFSGVYKCSRWWQFWHWFRKPKPQHKLFVVQERKS